MAIVWIENLFPKKMFKQTFSLALGTLLLQYTLPQPTKNGIICLMFLLKFNTYSDILFFPANDTVQQHQGQQNLSQGKGYLQHPIQEGFVQPQGFPGFHSTSQLDRYCPVSASAFAIPHQSYQPPAFLGGPYGASSQHSNSEQQPPTEGP